MSPIFINKCIDTLLELVDEYNNSIHIRIKMKPVYGKPDTIVFIDESKLNLFMLRLIHKSILTLILLPKKLNLSLVIM